MLKEFKAFAVKGNVVDMAVGVVIGAAFGGIVTNLVENIIMPPLGFIVGKVDFSNLFIPLDEKARKAAESVSPLEILKKDGGTAIKYGLFINSLLNFLIVALAIFMVVKFISRLLPPPPPAPPATKDCPQCAMAVPVKAVKCGHCQSALS